GVAAIVSQPCSGNPSPSLAVIDVMVGYSAAARQAAGGTRPIELMIKAFIDETNQAMQNSFTGVRLQVAKRPAGNPTMIRPRPAGPPFRETRFTIPSNLCISEVVYAETGDVHKDLDALIDSQDGILDAAHTARDLCKADISVLILEDVGYFGGKAWIPPIPDVRFAPWAFAVVRRDSAIANTAFSHEVGHLFGGGHDVQNGGPAMCPYSAGWRLQAGVVRYRTVMAYKCATYPCSGAVPILFFSDPNILFGGVAVGSVNAQNARTIRIAAPTVSMYR
ncbi:MAG TPA: zinc-dependent metalloprotease family protein, partial [Thermoanaerobaculia bacterium]|nr:zinc-dependent metalloprotease family protein [Thermoanaerobaculia bacterium]